MLLNEAIRKSRKELGLSQKKLAEMAGIQRKQLSTLEAGGNVTLSTLRKVLVHLPNLETFSFDAVTATVRREVSDAEKAKAITSAMQMMGTAVQLLMDSLGNGKLPDDQEMMGRLTAANAFAYEALGKSPEDLERDLQKLQLEETPPPEPLTPESAAEALAQIKATGVDINEMMRLLAEMQEEMAAAEEPEADEDTKKAG